MDMGAQTAYLASKLTIFMVLAAGLLLAFTLGVSVSDADYTPVMLLLLAITGTAWVLISGKNYWILIPLSFSLSVPALPVGPRAFELAELSTMACFGLFCARMAFKVQNFNLMRIEYLWVGAYVVWVAVIYMKNPAGLLLFGSSSGGARFYFKIVLAFLAFLVLSNQRFGEKECKWIVWLMLAGSLGTSLVGLRGGLNPTDTGSNFGTIEEDVWQQGFIGPLMTWMSYLLGRYRMDQIFSLARFYLIPFMAFLLAGTLMTGKRAVFAVMVAMPMFMAGMRRQWQFVAAGAVCAVLLVSSLVMGHGKLFELPYRVQRTLMYLPGDWDPRLRGVMGEKGTMDSFREKMNEKAMENIKENPWVGLGYQIKVEEFQRMLVTTSGGILDSETQIEMLAQGSAWHNQWLGIAADFGIPASIIWLFYYVQLVGICLWLWKKIPFGSYRHILLVMVGLFFFSQILTSWTGGHSALTPFGHWWMFGILISMRNNLKAEAMEQQESMAASPRTPEPMTAGS